MTIKTTGIEFKRFYTDATYWPQDDGNTYHEDEDLVVDGAAYDDDYENIADTAAVSISGGVVFGPQWNGDELSFETYFKRWRSLQSRVVLILEMDKSKESTVVAAIKAAGGKIVK